MAAPTLMQLLILLGDGATPTEGFAHPCGANTRSIRLINNTGEELLLDCTDPLGAQATINRYLESQDSSLSISGKVASESLAAWRAWADDGGSKNIKAEVHSGGALVGYWDLPALLTEFEITSDGKKNAEFNASIVGAGARTWTDAP